MLGLSKLKSNKGYIFTMEAVIVVTIALLLFYFAYFAITHNVLTFHETKRNIETFEKSNLRADKIFKDHEFPSNSYVPDYMRFVDRVRESYYTSRDTIPGTFDPYSVRGTEYEGNISYEGTWEYIITIYNPNNYDLKDFQVLVTLTPSNFNFDFSPDGKGISFWEGNRKIPYWIEIWEYNRLGRVWIRVGRIKANSYTVVYLRKGQGGGSNAGGNGEEVFIFFEDFERESNKWKILKGEWVIVEDNELPFYNGGRRKNHVAYLDSYGNKEKDKYRSMISSEPLRVSDGDIYILEAVVKGHTGAVGGSADSPDTMVGFYATPNVDPYVDPDYYSTNYEFYNSFTGYRQIFAICRNYVEKAIYLSNIFTYDNVWYHEKFILEHSNDPKDRICNASIWKFFNGYYGDPNPNDNRYSMVKTRCSVTKSPSQQRYILLGTGEGTHSEVYWFDNVRVRKYAPRIHVTVEENIWKSVKNITRTSPYYFENIPHVESNVNVITVIYPKYNFSNIYVKTENRLVPVKMWRYPNEMEIREDISMGEILYFGTRRPSNLEYIRVSAREPVSAVISVNGIPFKMKIDSTPRISDFGKVINVHSWDINQPNEIKILEISKDVPITLDIKYSDPSTIYVLKFKPINISCIMPLEN